MMQKSTMFKAATVLPRLKWQASLLQLRTVNSLLNRIHLLLGFLLLLFFRVNFVENFIGANIKGFEEKVKVS